MRTIIAILLCSMASLAHAQDATRFLGKRADEWVRQLKTDSEPRQRRNAAFALGQMGGRAAEVLGQIKVCLEAEKDARVREATVFALGELARDSLAAGGDAGIEELLCRVLQSREEEPLVRRSAAYALGALGTQSPRAYAALEAAGADPEAVVRQNAAWALGQFREAALGALKKSLRDGDPLVQRDAAAALLQMKDPEKVRTLVPDLAPLCTATHSEVRRAAVNVLVRVVEREDKAAVPALRGLLEDRDLEIKRNAALALSNIGGKEAAPALPVLLATLRADDVEVRRLACAGLGNLGPDAAAAIPDLLQILRTDKDAETRAFAANSLGAIGVAGDDVVSTLVDRARDRAEVARVRAGCATALNYLGARDPDRTRPAIPRLLGILQDPGEEIDVRGRIIWALRPNFRVLPEVPGVFETFGAVLKEPRTGLNAMLRYDCAFMLGVIWQDKAPDATLDVLHEFLKDSTIKIFESSNVSVGGTGAETSSGRATALERGKGDGRIMATDALKAIGRARWANRKDIVAQLRILAADATIDAELRNRCAELVKMAE